MPTGAAQGLSDGWAVLDTESRRVPLDEMEDTLCAFEVGDGSLFQWTRPRWQQAPADRQGAPGPLCADAAGVLMQEHLHGRSSP